MKRLTTALLSLLLIPAIGVAQEVSKSGNNWYVINSSPSGKLTIGTSGAQPVELIVNQAGTSPKGFRVNGTTGNLEGISGTEGISVPGSGLFADGTVGAPSIAFSSDADGTGTGFYRLAANVFATSNNGVGGLAFSGSAMYGITDGAIDLGIYSTNHLDDIYMDSYIIFKGSADPGIYQFADNQELVMAGGLAAATTSGAFIILDGDDKGGTNAGAGATLNVGDNAAAKLSIVHNATEVAAFNSGGLDITGELSATGLPTASGVICRKADGDLGQCTSVVAAGGTCTCA